MMENQRRVFCFLFYQRRAAEETVFYRFRDFMLIYDLAAEFFLIFLPKTIIIKNKSFQNRRPHSARAAGGWV